MTKADNPLTAGELIAELSKLDPSTIIVLSRDPEGNGYSPAYNCEAMNYEDGEVRFSVLTKELRDFGYCEEDAGPGQPALVIWPMY